MPAEITEAKFKFEDDRLNELLVLYKARNFKDYLTKNDLSIWNQYRLGKFASPKNMALEHYFGRINELKKSPGVNAKQLALLEDLEKYGELIYKSL